MSFSSSPSSSSWWKLIFCLFAALPIVQSEVRPFSLLLEPASEYIHYVEGYLVSPGYIDLSELRFFTIGTGDFIIDDEDDGFIDDFGDDGTRRQLDEDDEGTDFFMEGSALDIAVFRLPPKCANSRTGCDWPDLGIGARTDDGVLRYCCTNEAISLGLCPGTNFGRLIIDGEKYEGKHRLMNIPATGVFDSNLKYGKFEEKSGHSGKYAVIFANCNDNGRPVIVEGTTEWKSHFGFLPGELFGLMYFDAFMFFVYFGLMLWYGITMKMYEDANIPIQGWIFGTIAMGCLELFFRTGDLFVWNEEGERFWAAFYFSVIVGVLKRGISRCLIVMVALGWGVVRDDLGPVMNKINFLGGLYIAISLIHDIMSVIAYTEVQRISQEEEDELFDIVAILTMVIALIDVLFYLWVIDSLNATMEYLESLSQTSKLLRYLRLRSVLLFSILFAVIWSVFGIVDGYDEGIVDEDSEWVIDAFTEINYVFVLTAVAVLWRPQENAKEYAYVMQLPTMKAADDSDDEEGALELTGVVPSAMDDEDEYGGFNDEHQ